jgi:hypothetical protein
MPQDSRLKVTKKLNNPESYTKKVRIHLELKECQVKLRDRSNVTEGSRK